MPASRRATAPRPAALWWAALILLVATGGSAGAFQALLEDDQIAGTLVSRGLWTQIVTALGGTIERSGLVAPESAGRIFISLAVLLTVMNAAAWLAGAGLIAWRSRRTFGDALALWGRRGWAWWLIPAVWEAVWVGASLLDLAPLVQFALSITPLALATALAGWLATFVSLSAKPARVEALPPAEPRRGIPVFVWLAAAVWALVSTAMNWQLYFALNLPHGDSAMYEEHLWNLTHGQGFRSYLDQGLFLGEHIQVIHVLLVPLYVLWPSHLLLEACQAVALASGAIAVFLLARRHTGSERAGCCLATAYLLYFPLHFLDISIDLKTFRPMSFSVPLVLFALDQLERGRWKTMLVLLALALSSKEDLAIIIAPLGVWIAVQAWRSRLRRLPRGRDAGGRVETASVSQKPAGGTQYSVPSTQYSVPTTQHSADDPIAPVGRDATRLIVIGLTLMIGATVYLAAVVGWVIPAFRSGETVHYSRYFQAFGETPGEIVRTMLTDPGRVARAFLTVETLLYAAALLVPLGLLPLLSPGRLAVGLPLFFVLCLNEIARTPQHHFHAPVVPIVLWAAAAGLGNLARWRALRRTEFHSVRDRVEASAASGRSETPSYGIIRWSAHFAWTSALATGLFFSLSPLGIAFWDPGSAWHWRTLYVPGERAARFARIEPLIPRTARVASTDFVHPRFTHHARSYDYSEYPRAVNDNRPGAPRDTDFIVIDKEDRYRAVAPPEQRIEAADDLPEYRRSPGSWDVLVDDPYFLVLQRKPAT